MGLEEYKLLRKMPQNGTVAVYSGAHPAHQEMLAGCCDESIKMLGEWSPGKQTAGAKKLIAYLSTALSIRASSAKVAVIEGTIPTVLMAPIINCLNRRPKPVIALCAEDALYRIFVTGGSLKQLITRWGFQFVSGIITNSDQTANLIRSNLGSVPIETRYPSIPEERIRLFSSAEPLLDSHNLILIGGGSQFCKGVDIATKCLEILRGKFPDIRLTVLGFPDLKETPGLVSPGSVDDILPYLSTSSVLIHPGRGEAFGLAIIEAMLAGVVPFVSEWTGASSIVKEAASNLVVPLCAEDFASRIAVFWNDTPDHRQTLSAKCRQVALDFSLKALKQPSLAPFIEYIASNKLNSTLT
ncbi:MAG: glycosyltransferase family 4 protein [Actinomycetota bacterium]|nr:glycosyltransferase family 4 protein [Actinomycetota bacterium]